MKLLKKIVLAATLAAFSLTLVTSPITLIHAAQAVNVTSIAVKGPSNALKPKQTFQLKPIVTTSPKVGNVKITYSSTNTKVATISVSGLVTAVSSGKAIIYISSGGKSTYAVINVASSTVNLSTGLWVEKKDIKKSEEQLLTDGAIYFELKSFKNNVLAGHFFSISSPPSNRIAGVENMKINISNGKGTFTYTDDGWGNSGKGTVEFKGNSIVFSFKETKSDSSAMWNLGSFTVTLYKGLAVPNQNASESASTSSDNNMIGFINGEWSSEEPDELRVNISLSETELIGTITYYGQDGDKYVYQLTYLQITDDQVRLFLKDDQKSMVALLKDNDNLVYWIVLPEKTKLSGDPIVLTKVN